MRISLRPCPKCGNTKPYIFIISFEHKVTARCDCGYKTKTYVFKGYEEEERYKAVKQAADAWNERGTERD